MSEVILKALMQLFALIVKQDSGVSGNERKYVEHFLTQQLRREVAAEYLELFDKYAVTENVDVLVSVKDSVRVLRICQQINTTLTQRQKVVVLLRVFELVNAVPKFSAQRMFIINTIAEVFNLTEQEYQSIRSFVVGNKLEQFDIENVLVITRQDFSRQYARFLKHEELNGILIFLHIPSVDLYFLRYLGTDEVLLNGMLINKQQIGLLPMGSNIKLPKYKPFYYGDIVAQFYADSFSTQLHLEAKNLHLVFPGNAIGLQNISFSERNGQLVGIMGASGSGKTTLLNVLCGLEKPTSGEVLINGVNLHTHKEDLEGFIGYIPQDDVLIEELTVFDNLYYNAQLCFRNKTRDELEHLVSKTLHSLGLYEIQDLKVGSFMNKTISGGQRKRLNIALEMLREPSILFVDEPTSGLSSNDSENVMDLMSELARKGKQVFVVIHQPSSDIFKMFDKIIILDKGGYMIYYGNPIEAVMYFKRASQKINSDMGECPACGNVNPELIFNIIDEKEVDELGNYTDKRKISPSQWESIYQQESVSTKTGKGTYDKPTSKLNIPNWFKQWKIYLTRDVLSKVSNRQYLLLTLLEAPVLGVILAYVIRYIADPLSNVYIFRENENVPIFIFMSLIVALFLGLIVSAEEIFRDRKILKREAFLNLSKSSYLIAKICVLVVISALQCFLFVIIANTILGVKEMYFAYWLALFSTAVFANILGLVISNSFNSAVTIYIVIPLLMIPMMVLSGAMFSFDKLNHRVGSVDKVPLVAEFMITRWSYEALMVHQYKDNRFERYFYDVEKRESVADFRQVYLIPELKLRYELCANELSATGKIQNNIQALLLLKNEVKKELAINPQAQFDLSLLDTDNFDTNAASYLEEFIESMNAFYMQQFSLANQEKEQLIAYMLEQNKKGYTDLKNACYNEHLGETVKKFFEKNKILEYNHQLVQEIDPIYQDPSITGRFSFRTHFFAPRKYFAGTFFDTYWFNICMIWIISITLYFILYFDVVKRVVTLFQYNKKIHLKILPL
ncbi:MAG: ATP-binding cassette domain-containing protein [Bacteroidales bacterium]|jgi:ABC-type multidrug transport system ATPase subunit|nr:ATP-binding cassette domain-containing protein [Bacteroidales bacterium]